MPTNVDFLKSRLRAFKRRYYLYRALGGLIEAVVVSVVWIMIVAAVAYFYPMARLGRGVLFYGSVVGLVLVWLWRVGVPLMRALTLRRVMSDEAAAALIGAHFPEVKDRLLNVLQLEQLADDPSAEAQRRWIAAAVAQKAKQLRPVPFQAAVKFRRLRRYLRYAVPAFAAVGLVAAIAPSVLSEGAERVIYHYKPMDAFAPFRFEVVNTSLRVARGEPWQLQIRTRGERLPQQVMIEVGGRRYWMEPSGEATFAFSFERVDASFRFRLHADGFRSEWYAVEVVPAPALRNVEVRARYPSYLGMKKEEVFRDVRYLEVPAGTRLRWTIVAADAERVEMLWPDTAVVAHPHAEGVFVIERQVHSSAEYRVAAFHPEALHADTQAYSLSVIADQPPTVEARFVVDTATFQYVAVQGTAADDHGFSRAVWAVGRPEGPDGAVRWQRFSLPRPSAGETVFSFVQWKALDSLWEGASEIRMYVEVWDNDAVTGPKSARTPLFVVRKPTLDELRQREEQAARRAQAQMSAAHAASRTTHQNLENRLLQMIQQPKLHPDDRRSIQQLLENIQRQKQTWEKALEQMQQTLHHQRQTQADPSTIQQLEELQERMKEIFDEQFQRQLAELERLLQNGADREIQQKLKELLEKQRAVEEAMERDLAMYRRWRLERQMEWQALKLEELAEQQKELADETRRGDAPSDSLAHRQDSLTRALDSVAAAHERLQREARELDEEVPDLREGFRSARQAMQNAAGNLRNGQRRQAASGQQQAAEQLRQMAQTTMTALQQRRKNTLMVSRRKLRQILDNLLEMSARQEELERRRNVGPRTRAFLRLMEQQRQLNEVTADVEDSLRALARQVPTIKQYVFNELDEIRHYQQLTVSAMTERNVGLMRQSQRRVMMHTNRLALMLSEILDNMTAQLASMMSSSQQCNNPSPSPSPSLQQMQQMQQGLQQQLQQSMQGRQGQTQGRDGRQEMTEEMARILMQQEVLRHHIRRLRQEQDKEAKRRFGKLLEEIEKMMERVEQDIVHQRVGRATLERMERIRVRMLEAERAQRQQDESPERQARTAMEVPPSVPPSLRQYLQEKQRHAEILRRIPPQLQPFYRDRARKYLQRIP